MNPIVSHLWRRVQASAVTPPPYRNASRATSFRSYGGGDARLNVDANVLRLAVRSTKAFVPVFAFLFIPAFAATAWLMIPDPPMRYFFSIGGTLVGTITFTVIYALLDYHERLGDYLVIDRDAGSLSLPRLKKQFPLAQVDSFQWIRGGSRGRWGVQTDLNLLVSEADGLVRYHVLSDPQRRTVEEVIRFCGLPLEEVDVGPRGDRNGGREGGI